MERVLFASKQGASCPPPYGNFRDLGKRYTYIYIPSLLNKCGHSFPQLVIRQNLTIIASPRFPAHVYSKPSQVKSSEIKEKMCEAEETEKEIEARSEEYRPVAKRASLLYFCLADLAVVRT